MKLNKVTLEPLTSAIKDLTFIRDLLIDMSKESYRTEEEYICLRYISVQNVSKISKELNENGYRISGRKYIGKDVSKVISNTPSKIGEVAKALSKYNNTLQNGTRSFTSLLRELKAAGDTNES